MVLHTIDWSGSDANLISSTGTASNTFTFSPATMSAGSYKAAVEVADSGISDSVFSASVVIVVKEEEVKAIQTETECLMRLICTPSQISSAQAALQLHPGKHRMSA